jgi:hypothetical protein
MKDWTPLMLANEAHRRAGPYWMSNIDITIPTPGNNHEVYTQIFASNQSEYFRIRDVFTSVANDVASSMSFSNEPIDGQSCNDHELTTLGIHAVPSSKINDPDIMTFDTRSLGDTASTLNSLSIVYLPGGNWTYMFVCSDCDSETQEAAIRKELEFFWSFACGLERDTLHGTHGHQNAVD